MINRADNSISSTIASNFRDCLKEKEHEVSIIFYPEHHLLKSRPRLSRIGWNTMQKNMP